MSSISLVISPQSVEYVGGRLDPDTDSRLNAYRLVHEQQGRAGDVRWFFFAKADLSKPEALSRAQQVCLHPSSGLAGHVARMMLPGP